MLVALGRSIPSSSNRLRTSAMPSRVGVGSSKYSRSAASARPISTEVSTVQAQFGSIRSGTSGPKALRMAWIASISWSGGSTPGLELDALEAEAVEELPRLVAQSVRVHGLAEHVLPRASSPSPPPPACL